MGHDDLHFGRVAVRLGFIEPKQLASCLQIQKEMLGQGQSLHISQILLKQGLITTLQIDAIMKASVRDMSLDKTNLRPPTQQMGVAKTLTKKTGKTDKMVNSLGRYRILEEIGRGGMGRVYRAQDTQLDRIVAIKKLIADDDKESVARFLREAKATAKLDHPNIVKVYELGEEEDQYYFVMDYVEGVSLQALAQKSTLTIRQIAEIMGKIANAVQYAHDQGIIHRDLKPGNVMLTGDNEPKIMDFGLAKVSGDTSKLSQSGVVLGTLQYMPPEQAEGRLRAIDKVSDVYSIGAIMYELLTGKPPFTGNSFSHVLEQVLHREPIPPTQLKHRIPKSMEAICLKAMQKDKSRRYPSAKDFSADLSNFLRGKKIKGVSGGGREMLKKLLKKIKSYKVIVAVSAGVLLLVILLAFAFAGGRSEKKDQGKSTKHKIAKEKEPVTAAGDPQAPQSVLTMIAKVVDGNKAEKSLFTSGETIQIEVGWDFPKPPDDAALEVQIYGEKIKTLVNPVAKDTRKFYCPITLLDDAQGNVEVTVQLRAGQTSAAQRLNFNVEKVEPKTISFVPTIVNKKKVPQSHFAVGEEILLEGDWSGGGISSDIKVYIVFSGEGIRRRKYSLPLETKKLYFAVELADNKSGHYELRIELISGPNKMDKTLPFTVGDIAEQGNIAFEILMIRPQGKDGKPRTKFKWNEDFEVLVHWQVNSAPAGTKQEVRITGTGVESNTFPYDLPAVPGKGFMLTITLFGTEKPRTQTMELSFQVMVGNVVKERTTVIQVGE